MPPKIEHVVCLMMENRSFDHMLGFLPHPDARYEGLLRGDYAEAGVRPSPTSPFEVPVDPPHSNGSESGAGRPAFRVAFRPWCRFGSFAIPQS